MTLGALCLVGCVLAGCGGDEGSSSSPTPTATATVAQAPPPVDFCAGAGAGSGWRKLAVRSHGEALDAAALGRGPAVVLLNQSDNDSCAWIALARSLADRGHAVATFRYSDTTASGERQALRDSLAVADAIAGGERYVMIGASLGGRLVFEAAARKPKGLAGIVSLSGETVVEDYRDITADIRRVSLPVLYAGAQQDPLTEGSRQPRRIRSALASRDTEFVLLPGPAHGVELLDNASVRGAVEKFPAQRLP